MPIDGYTTSVAAASTLDKVTKLLAAAKVRRIQTTYSDKGEADGLIFQMDTPWGPRDFSLPINAEGVRQTLIRDRVEKRYKTIEHANRVAWRIAHKWLQAQLAIIDAGMVTMHEVMFPYLILGYDDQAQRPITTYSHYTNTQKELTS